jgi:hypothetical protein
MEQPYEVKHILSYCDSRRHKGTIYQAAAFERVRINNQGIETYRRSVRKLTPAEHAVIGKRSQEDQRAQQLRALAHVKHIEQLPLLSPSELQCGGVS